MDYSPTGVEHWACFPEASDRECRADVVYAKCLSEKRLASPRSLARRIEAQRHAMSLYLKRLIGSLGDSLNFRAGG